MSVRVMEISPASNTQWHPGSNGKWHAESYIGYDGESPTVSFRVVYSGVTETPTDPPWQPGSPLPLSRLSALCQAVRRFFRRLTGRGGTDIRSYGRFYYDFPSVSTGSNPVRVQVKAQNSTG